MENPAAAHNKQTVLSVGSEWRAFIVQAMADKAVCLHVYGFLCKYYSLIKKVESLRPAASSGSLICQRSMDAF